MRKIVLVANTKGGVGKTTLAQHFLLPALGKAIYVDTDSYNSSIKKIENSKHLVKAIKLRAIITESSSKAGTDAIKLAEEFGELFEKEKSENIVIDTGPGLTAAAVLEALLPTFSEDIDMVFIPASEDITMEKTVGFVSAFTDRYVIVNIRKKIYDTPLFIPEISESYFELSLRHKITLPEIEDIQPENLNLVGRGLRNLFVRLFKPQINKAIEDIREILLLS
ncbi:MAG: hypothetical protein QXQ50_08180 [Candidatus Bathyarchaeia archaeon]